MSESAPAPAAPRGLDAALKDAIRASYDRLKQALPGSSRVQPKAR